MLWLLQETKPEETAFFFFHFHSNYFFNAMTLIQNIWLSFKNAHCI